MCWCRVIVGHLDTSSITSVGAMVLWNRSNMMAVSHFLVWTSKRGTFVNLTWHVIKLDHFLEV